MRILKTHILLILIGFVSNSFAAVYPNGLNLLLRWEENLSILRDSSANETAYSYILKMSDLPAGSKWYIETYASALQAYDKGIKYNYPNLVSLGIKGFDFAMQQQLPDGSFPEKTDLHHSVSFYYEALDRFLILSEIPGHNDSITPAIRQRLQDGLRKGIIWFAKKSSWDDIYWRDDFNHRFLLKPAAILMAQRALGGLPQETLNQAYQWIDTAYVRQWPNGVMPEKGGYDTHYQSIGMICATGMLLVCDLPADVRTKLETIVQKGISWLQSRVNTIGEINDVGNTRTGGNSPEISRFSGLPKSIVPENSAYAIYGAAAYFNNAAFQKTAYNIMEFLNYYPRFVGRTCYVDSIQGNVENDGLSWGKAKQSINQALAVASINIDNIWIKGGQTFVYNDTTSSAVSPSPILNIINNWYGGFMGNETSISQRPLIDTDGNGIIEPWEFQYPTTLRFHFADKTAISLGTSDFNGFALNVNGSFTSRYNACFNLAETANFKNNIIKGCHVNLSMTVATDKYAPFIKGGKTISNCLFEKDTVIVTATANGYCSPFIYVGNNNVLSTLSGTRFLNNVIRNNKVTLDYSTAANGILNDKSRGLLMQVGAVLNASPQVQQQSTVANCVIHNNEISYIKNDQTSMSNGSLLSTNYGAVTDSILNNTIVNNKGTLIKCAGLNILSLSQTVEYHYVINNAFYNNQVGGIVNNIYGTNSLGKIANNYFNGGGSTYTNNGTTIQNNDGTLANSGKMPNFKTPTTLVGNTNNGSSESSNWRIMTGSYLAGKGMVTSQLNDKNGVQYLNPRSVGAYEINSTNTITEIPECVNNFTAINGRIFSKIDGYIEIFDIKGQKVWEGKVSIGDITSISKGAYIVRSFVSKQVFVQKIIL